MIYVAVLDNGDVDKVYSTRTDETQLEVQIDFFKDYPQPCWEYNGEALVLKTDADAIRDAFFAPPEPEPETPTYAQVSPVQFKLLFTSAERLAIKTLKTTDPMVEDFYEIVDDPRLETVDFSLQSVRDGVTYVFGKLVEGGTLTQEEMDARLPQVFTGEMI